MASEFQRRKVAGVFNAMDADKDGFLERDDFEALAARWTGFRAWMQDTAEYEAMRTTMMAWWDKLRDASDQNRDHRVSLDEVMLAVDRLGALADDVIGTANTMFDAIDADKDGRISEQEYRQVVQGWKGPHADTAGIFPKLDSDGDGYLSREEFASHWNEFWVGDDETSPSQFVFGTF